MQGERLRLLMTDRDLIMSMVSFMGNLDFSMPVRIHPCITTTTSHLAVQPLTSETLYSTVERCGKHIHAIITPSMVDFAAQMLAVRTSTGMPMDKLSLGIFADVNAAQQFLSLRSQYAIEVST